MGSDDRFDDPIAAAFLGDSAYARIRARRHSLFKQSIARKLTWQSAILAALALVLPLAMTLPASTRALFPGGDPMAATPKILVLGAYAGVIELVAAAGLTYVGVRLWRGGDALSEPEIHHLLTVEDVASYVSIVTGAAAVAAVDGVFLLGLGGEAVMDSFFAAGGLNPFAGAEIPVTVSMVAVPAAVLAFVLFGLSRVFARRLPA